MYKIPLYKHNKWHFGIKLARCYGFIGAFGFVYKSLCNFGFFVTWHCLTFCGYIVLVFWYRFLRELDISNMLVL